MNILVKSKIEFDSYLPTINITDDTVDQQSDIYFISICNTSNPNPYFKQQHTQALSLEFDDTDYDIYETVIVPTNNGNFTFEQSDKITAKAMTQEQGEVIYNFIKTIDPIQAKLILVHCSAGISRSGAVGLFCSEYFKDYIDIHTFNKNNKHIQPNSHILRILHNLHLYGHYIK